MADSLTPNPNWLDALKALDPSEISSALQYLGIGPTLRMYLANAPAGIPSGTWEPLYNNPGAFVWENDPAYPEEDPWGAHQTDGVFYDTESGVYLVNAQLQGAFTNQMEFGIGLGIGGSMYRQGGMSPYAGGQACVTLSVTVPAPSNLELFAYFEGAPNGILNPVPGVSNFMEITRVANYSSWG